MGSGLARIQTGVYMESWRLQGEDITIEPLCLSVLKHKILSQVSCKIAIGILFQLGK